MKSKFTLIALICITSFMSGCATTGGSDSSITKEGICFLAMSATGAGAGALASNNKAAIGGGAILGGLVGYYLCQDEKTTPVAQKKMMDSDGDGVMDDMDNCPNTPRGTPVNASGCPLDSDGDGVTDNNDRCPNTPRGVAVNSTGCPLDTDGDGVIDGSDDCPNTPMGQAVNERGCHVIFSLEGVNFAYDKSDLTATATGKLNEAVKMLKDSPAINVKIEGHTDSRGSDAYNMALSQRRAETVVNFLVNHGIAANRVSASGMGEGSPVASNDTDAGRAQNRRVDFRIQN